MNVPLKLYMSRFKGKNILDAEKRDASKSWEMRRDAQNFKEMS